MAPLIDGLGYEHVCTHGLHASWLRHGLVKLACRWGSRYMVFVETSCVSARYKSGAIMHIGFFACLHSISLERSHFRKITLLFSGSRSSEDVVIANGPPRSLEGQPILYLFIVHHLYTKMVHTHLQITWRKHSISVRTQHTTYSCTVGSILSNTYLYWLHQIWWQ